MLVATEKECASPMRRRLWRRILVSMQIPLMDPQHRTLGLVDATGTLSPEPRW